jgi:2-furoyl-CoA dehydrogenase large subunit
VTTRTTTTTETARAEDVRLVTGRGRFADDEVPTGALHAAFVRSPFAHAAIGEIDVDAALAAPGVRAVFTGARLVEELDPFPSVVRGTVPYFPVAVDEARYAGEPVAVVLADDRYAAEDGAGLVAVDFEPLDVVVDPLVAAADPDAVAWERRYAYGEPTQAFARAARVVSIETTFPKYNSTPLETYAVVADWDRATGDLEVRSNFQGPYSLVPVLCRALRIPTSRLRMVAAEDIGGSFGIKAMVYPYIAVAAVCSRLAGRAVVWIEDRQEHLYGSASGTDRVTRADAALDEEGRIVALRFDIVENVGAYLRAPEPSCVMRSVSMFAGPYRIPDGEVAVRVVTTNKLPTGLNRGYGGQQHIFTLERLLDAVARELGVAPDEVRRRHFIRPEDFPYRTPSGTHYDSGAYERALDRALELSDYRALRDGVRDRGDRWVGVGLATAIHSSAANMGYVTLAIEPGDRSAPNYRPKSGMREWARLAVDASGAIALEIGSAGCGQGHRETAANIVARLLEIDPGLIRVADALDTARDPWSVSSGSYSSRFAVMAGNAVHLAACELREQLLDVGAHVLGVARTELTWADGAAVGEAGRAPLRELAGAVHWDGGSSEAPLPQLIATATFSGQGAGAPDPDDRVNAALAYGFMADVAVVEIDKETLIPRVVRYVAVHDVGNTLEPALVAGQTYGGIAHGIGGALLEHLAYSEEGQLLSGSFVDYHCVAAADAPEVVVEHANAPSPFNPLGVKGSGESSAMSAPAAIAAAVEDALRHTSLTVNALPVDPAGLWRAVS